LLARPRGLLAGLLACAPATAIAVMTAYDADLLASDNPTTAPATSQGHHVALVVAACVLGAAAVRTIALPLDDALSRVHLPARMRVWVPAAAWRVGALLAAAGFLAAHGPREVSHNYHRFVPGNGVVLCGVLRGRLGGAGGNRLGLGDAGGHAVALLRGRRRAGREHAQAVEAAWAGNPRPDRPLARVHRRCDRALGCGGLGAPARAGADGVLSR